MWLFLYLKNFIFEFLEYCELIFSKIKKPEKEKGLIYN